MGTLAGQVQLRTHLPMSHPFPRGAQVLENCSCAQRRAGFNPSGWSFQQTGRGRGAGLVLKHTYQSVSC